MFLPHARRPTLGLLGLLAGLLLLAAGLGSRPAPVQAAAVPFVPFIDMVLWPTPDLATFSQDSGATTFYLGFVQATGSTCVPQWGGIVPLTEPAFLASVQGLRNQGGDVIVSFGGAAGISLPEACPDAASLALAIRQVIDTYQLTRIDFDIEGAAIGNLGAVTRLGQAVALVQQHYQASGTTIWVSYTLPVLPQGLTAQGLDTIAIALNQGATVDLVNIMAMNYGDANAPAPDGQMGRYAIDAMDSTHAQLATVFPALTPAQRWARLGVTPMIGQNDLQPEIFRAADAVQVQQAAASRGAGLVSMWSAHRDRQCTAGVVTTVQTDCSGILQAPWAFSQAFLGASAPGPTPTPPSSPTPGPSPTPSPAPVPGLCLAGTGAALPPLPAAAPQPATPAAASTTSYLPLLTKGCRQGW